MRIRIVHDTIYRYDNPPASVIQTLRLTPRNYDGQFVQSWRIDVSADCRLAAHEDAFGNLGHTFTVDGPLDALTVHVEGEVDTIDLNGVISGAIERFPPALFLRETALTRLDPAIADLAAQTRASSGQDTLPLLHALMARLNQEMTFDTDPTHAATTASEAFALKRGVCQDLTHIFIAAARSLGVPARYVSGYFHRADGVTEQDAGHAWAEAYVPRSRLGRVRPHQQNQRDRCPFARRGRARLSERGAGSRRAQRRRRRGAAGAHPCRSGDAAGAKLTAQCCGLSAPRYKGRPAHGTTP